MMVRTTHTLVTLLALFTASTILSANTAQGQEKKPEREVVIQPVIDQGPTQKEKEATKWNAGQFPNFGLGDVAIVKIVDKEEETRVSVLLNGFDQAMTPRTINYTQMVEEKRTRAIQKDGKEAVQTYTVMVPVVKKQVVVQSLATPQNSRRFEFALSEVRIWNIEGEQLDKDAIKSLKGARHVFIVRPGKEKQFKLDPYYASVLREDVLFIDANVPKPAAKGAPPVPAPAAAAFRAPAVRALRLAPARAIKAVRPAPAKKAEKIEKPVEKPIEKPVVPR